MVFRAEIVKEDGRFVWQGLRTKIRPDKTRAAREKHKARKIRIRLRCGIGGRARIDPADFDLNRHGMGLMAPLPQQIKQTRNRGLSNSYA